MQRPIRVALGAAIALALVMPAAAALTGTGKAYDAVAVERLKADTGARLTLSDATGTVRFARATQARSFGPAGSQKKADHSMSFLMANGKAFGLANARNELKLIGSSKDRIGASRVNFGQVYRGVPVFGATLMTHYDAKGNLTVVNGTIVPGIRVNTVPGKSAGEAGAAALRLVPGKGVAVRGSQLMIFREGLAKGVPGANHLAYEVEVGNGKSIREFVYIDAHTGKKIDQITGIFDAMDRRAYDATGLTAPGPNYPATPYWVEGDSFPTASTEANNMIAASKETYDLFKNAFGRDSFDGAGATMDSIFNRGNSCPNASWNGTYISFCPGLTTDDVTGHEWAHAYTEYTHGLIYAWQPGALNESYSDIWGETVDRINGRMTDMPFAQRTADSCSIYGGRMPLTVVVNSPAPIAGNYTAIRAPFGAQSGIVTGSLTLTNDGTGSATDGCSALVNFPAGDIALIDRGSCPFTVKAKNAQNAGASAVVIANSQPGLFSMGGSDASITIQSVSVSQADGNLFRANMPVDVTFFDSPAPSDDSVRWLLGEDDSAPSLIGPLRDMWNPRCYGNAGKVSDAEYTCSTTDGGGVHSNSGVPNHAYSLVVDGGTYNGQSITGIGLTKAAHIYFRAQSVYQGPVSDFADHADALEMSCADLTGVNLTDIQSGAPSGEFIDAGDCAQVAKAALAVQLRTPPTQCNFIPLLDQAPPALCAAGTAPSVFFHDEFESGDAWKDRWTVSRTEVHPGEFTPRDWAVVGDLPHGRSGSAFWAPDPNIGSCSASGVNNQAGVLHLYSKVISVAKPAKGARIAFDHSVATEAGWDGGNLSISVNGGAWQPVKAVDFIYNDYNRTLFTAGQGSDNPLAGQPAFSGADGGSVGDGKWGRSIINLAPYAPEGSKVQLRFDLGTDCAGGAAGWYIDDVKMYTCQRKK